MEALILGGTGAMGVPLIEQLKTRPEMTDITVTSRNGGKSEGKVRFVCGNARDDRFLESLLRRRYDVIVDYMNYDLDEFRFRIPKLLPATSHYVWFSSSRVYAESQKPLTESSPRLLETSTDSDFLATNRYALRKARQEDLLHASGFRNYTIIRPYITYNDRRLQLGIYEKEQWLYRILKGRGLVINKSIIDCRTTLSHGNDVSAGVVKLICGRHPSGMTFQIAGSETMTWREILNLYLRTIKRSTGITPPHLSIRQHVSH